MKNDPIVEEVRATRAKLVRKYGSAKKWMEHIMARESAQNKDASMPEPPSKPARAARAATPRPAPKRRKLA